MEEKLSFALYLSEGANYQMECTSEIMHDTENPPYKSYLEEIYYPPVQPTTGFAFQHVYDYEGLDETVAAHDGDLLTRRYHIVAAVPSCNLYYLNIMDGPHRTLEGPGRSCLSPVAFAVIQPVRQINFDLSCSC